MKIRLQFLTVCATLLLAPSAQAQFNVPDPAPGEDFTVELGLMFWTPTPQIGLQTAGGGTLGPSEVDFVDVFGIEPRRFTEFRAVVKAGRRHKIRVSRVPIEYNESTVLAQPVDFGDVTLPAGIQGTANVKWDLWRYGYEADLVSGDRALFGWITEVRVNTLMADVGAEGFGGEAIDVTVPWPTMGFILRVYPHRNFSLTAEYTGLGILNFIVRKVADNIGEDFDGKTRDLDLYGTLNFGRHAGIQGGYRQVRTEYTGSEESGDLEVKRLYFGGLVRF